MARSERTAWHAVAEELAAWATAGATPQLWWRDDDAFRETAQLRRLRELLSQETLVLAVVPGRLQDDLVRSLETWPRVAVVQHGWKHLNHAEAGAPPSEYPPGRLQAEVEDELARGQRTLSAAFQARFHPVFVPPWHRCAPWILHKARALGFDGVSGQAPPFPLLRHGYPGEVNIEIDISDWTREGRFVGARRLASQVCRALRLRREWSACDAPIGILSHHQRLAHEDFQLLADLIACLRGLGVGWVAADWLFASSPFQETAR